MSVDDSRYARFRLVMTKAHGRRVARAVHETTRDHSDPLGAWRASSIGLDFRRALVDQYVRDHYGLTVQSGPFAGMRYVEEAAGSLHSPKILGSYEQELHPYIAELPRYRRFVNVGCGEGFYAVGARLLAPSVEVFAFDIDPAAREKCRALAAANGVADGLHIAAECPPPRLADLAAPSTLVLLDIEGAEVELLRGLAPGAVAAADLLVETHTVGRRSTLGAVLEALASSHDMAIVEQAPRDWSRFPDIAALGQLDRFLAQWEGRGPEPWVVARSRAASPRPAEG